MLYTLYYYIRDSRKLYILINSSFFWVLIITSILIPDYLLFDESVTTQRAIFSTGDNFLMINKGLSSWRILVDLSVFLFVFSSILLIIRNNKNLKRYDRLTLCFGVLLIFCAGIFDQLIDLDIMRTTYLIPFSGFVNYLLLSALPFVAVHRQLFFKEDAFEQEKKLQSLINKSELIVVKLNRMGQVEFLSPYFYKITGFRPDEVIGKDWFEFCIPPEETFNVQGTFVELLSYEFHPQYLNPILTKEDSQIMIKWFNVRTVDVSGQITGSISIGVDVSDDIKERESMKRKLKEAEDLIIELNEKIEKL